MATYAVKGNQATVSSGLKGSCAIWSSATLKRIKWYEYIIGATAVPNSTDCNIQVDISRLALTTSLAGTAFTPNATDSADGAAVSVAAVNMTTEPAASQITSSLANFGLNQRSTARWAAAQESQYLIGPATATNGLYMSVLSPNFASTLATQVYFLE